MTPNTSQQTNTARPSDSPLKYHGSESLTLATIVCCTLAWLLQFYYLFAHHSPKTALDPQLIIFNLLFSSSTCSLLWYYKIKPLVEHTKYFTTIYLLSTFFLLINLRLSYYAHMHLCVYLLSAALLIKILNYAMAAYYNLRTQDNNTPSKVYYTSGRQWQLLFIRLFIGFDLVPHFCEKLFAGNAPRLEDVAGFSSMGIPHPLAFVLLAGLIELGGAFAVGTGFLTRIGAIGLAIYLLVATYLGGHFTAGFIWVSTGGGWEYPVLWTTLIASFALFGGGGFSLDSALCEKYQLPRWIKYCMGGQKNNHTQN